MQTYHKKVRNTDDLKDVWYFIYQNFTADSLRLRAAVDWITGTISYDVKNWKTENPKAGEIDYILRSNKAICSGYTELLQRLCDLLNIECQVVSGKARAFDSDIYLNRSKLTEDHAWNIVKLNGNWRIIDPTWVAGYVTGDIDDPQTRFVREFNEAYYFTEPSKFILNHYPTQAQHQLLLTVMDEKKFKNAPLFLGGYMKDSISEVVPNEALIKANVGDTVRFRFKTAAGYLRIAAWSPTQTKAEYETDLFPENGWVEFKYPIAVAGYYSLYVGRIVSMTRHSLLAYKLQVDSKKRL